MSTFTWIPEYGANQEVKPRLFKASFGDGYEQRSLAGINTRPRIWSLTFRKISTELDDIEDFLVARGGVESFDWTPPRGAAGKFVCEEWTRGVPDSAYDTLRATFREVFGE